MLSYLSMLALRIDKAHISSYSALTFRLRLVCRDSKSIQSFRSSRRLTSHRAPLMVKPSLPVGLPSPRQTLHGRRVANRESRCTNRLSSITPRAFHVPRFDLCP